MYFFGRGKILRSYSDNLLRKAFSYDVRLKEDKQHHLVFYLMLNIKLNVIHYVLRDKNLI